MKRKRLIIWSRALLIIMIFFCFTQCRKERTPLNVTLYNKPLSAIQSYIQGKWRLQYAWGGIVRMRAEAKYNSYIILSPDHIVIGNDSMGVIVDTTIVWKQVNYNLNDSTYLLTYYYPPAYGRFPISYIVDRIHNDTLILVDNASDGVYRYYTKWR